MKYKVIVTPTASQQIEEALDYIYKSSRSSTIVQNWANAIDEKIQSLDLLPNRYPICESKRLRERGLRRLPVKRRIIYYEVDEERKTVTICAVVYAKRDQEAALGEIDQ